MRRRLAEKTVHVHLVMPAELHERLVRRTGQETMDRKVRVTPSDIVRWAVEEYLATWEGATFVPAPPAEEKGT